MKIGWIGTGLMGVSMAGHLQAAGHELLVFNRTRGKSEALLKGGAAWCNTPAEVTVKTDILFTMVGNPGDVDETYFGPRGVFSVERPSPVVVDMTTSRPSLACTLAEKAALRGVESLDAPVSGGDVGARNATLAIMVGGKRETFEQVLPLFQIMGKTISFMGGPGAGQHTKMCNQILVAGNMIGVCESLLYAVKLGLDQQAVIDVIGKGAASSFLINNVGPKIVQGDFAPGFMVEHFIKDMGIALAEAEAVGLCLPGLALVKELYTAVKGQGHSRDGHQTLYLALKHLSGMK